MSASPRHPPEGDHYFLNWHGRWVSYGPRAEESAGLGAGASSSLAIVPTSPERAQFWSVYVWDDDPLGGQWNWVGDAHGADSAHYFAGLLR